MHTPLNDQLFRIMQEKIDSRNQKMSEANDKLLKHFRKVVIPKISSSLTEELHDWANGCPPTSLQSQFESDRIYVFTSGKDSDTQNYLSVSKLSEERGQHLYHSSSSYSLPSTSFTLTLVKPLIDFLEQQQFKKWRILFKNHHDPQNIYFQINIELDLLGAKR